MAEQNGMKGKLQASLPWLHWEWCYAHRLELACNDAFSSQLFRDLDDMLLRLYYLYEKSPKKCRDLSDLGGDLKEVYELPEGVNLPVRASRSRWITHKRKALQRVVDRYGAYLNHLAALTEDKSIKSTDRQRLKGYLLKWRQARMIIGSALYTDALKPASLLSLTLQNDDIDVVQGIKNILKSHTSLNKLTSQDVVEWPVSKMVLRHCFLSLEYQEEHTSSDNEKRRNTESMLYAAAHPVSKRKMLFMLRPDLPSLTATWTPGVPKPMKGVADEFLKVRLGGIPAGAEKIYVTVEAFKRIASNGLLCAMPGVSSVYKMKQVLKKVEQKGVAAHVGATYVTGFAKRYLFHTFYMLANKIMQHLTPYTD